MRPVEVTRGDAPVLLGIPHAGTWVPDEVAAGLNETGRSLADTDWHIDKLYAGLLPGATTVRAQFHRYVIDANRDPSGASLYPGQNTTALCPLTDFEGRPIHLAGCAPDAAEIARRREAFHAPYHQAIQAELDRLHDRHGVVVLFDCHSIRSEIPFLFPGRLPDLNLGTNEGRSCAPALERAVWEICAGSAEHTAVLNGRFKGGWTTRHYGDPAGNRHAVQLELAQSTYMTEAPPWAIRPAEAERLQDLLRGILQRIAALAPTLGDRA